MLFDSHAHLHDLGKTDEAREIILEEIGKNGKLDFVADIGYDLESSKLAAEKAGKYPWCVAVVGVHPHDVKSMTEDILMGIKELTGLEGVKAVGEIGLDYHYMRSEKTDQRYWFRRQIQLANDLKMPIVIHSREADQETLDILVEEGAFSDVRKSWFPKRPGPGGQLVDDARVDIHCFSGSAELGREYAKLGATLGICGPLTYNNNKKTVRVVEEVPIEYLMAETDAPYLTPVPFRGKPNRPWYVEYTVGKMAEIKGEDFDKIAKITLENARRFYEI